MKLKIILVALITSLFIYQSCSQIKKNELITVSIKEAIDSKKDLSLSNFVENDIVYIQLETNVYCPLNKNIRLYLNDSLIIAIAKEQIFLFDRNSGKFIREIGHVGRDPQGYSKTLYSNAYSEKENTILTKGWLPNSFYEYDISGKLISKKVPIASLSINSISTLNDSSYIGHVWNFDGKQKKKLIVFNNDGKEILSFPQDQSFEYDMKKHGISLFIWEGWFYSFKNQINFFERLSDTIYKVTPNHLTPRYVLSYGKYEVPYEIRYTQKFSNQNYYHIRSIYESFDYLFFTLLYNRNHYTGIYDKNAKLTRVSQIVENDIDNFVSFQLSSINGNGEIIGYQYADEIKEWVKNHPEKSEEFSSKVKNFNGINIFYNPIIMIGKLKK